MHFNERFAEAIKVTGSAAENTSGTSSAWVPITDCERLAFLVASSVGSLAVTLQQAQDDSGTGAKALNHEAATNAATGALISERAASVDTVVGAITVEALQEMLDLEGGFTHVQASIAAGAGNVAIVACQAGPRVRPAYKYA